jgi:hypothetical protein
MTPFDQVTLLVLRQLCYASPWSIGVEINRTPRYESINRVGVLHAIFAHPGPMVVLESFLG